MCRFALYKGPPLRIADLIIEPENSLLRQARCGGDVALLLGIEESELFRAELNNQLNERVNGDGFGVAWYALAQSSSAFTFKLPGPAWANRNLTEVARYVTSPLIFAHIRAASSSVMEAGSSSYGHMTPVISEQNCHPFRMGRYIFMHNGVVPEFKRIKRRLRELLDDDTYNGIEGTTDSEHLFGLFLHHLGADRARQRSVDELANALQEMIKTVLHLLAANGIELACSLNIAIADGVHVVCSRFRSSQSQDPPSLYFRLGGRISREDGGWAADHRRRLPITTAAPPSEALSDNTGTQRTPRCGGLRGGSGLSCHGRRSPMESDADNQAVMVSSEPLSTHDDWVMIPKDHMVLFEGHESSPHGDGGGCGQANPRVASVRMRRVVAGEAELGATCYVPLPSPLTRSPIASPRPSLTRSPTTASGQSSLDSLPQLPGQLHSPGLVHSLAPEPACDIWRIPVASGCRAVTKADTASAGSSSMAGAHDGAHDGTPSLSASSLSLEEVSQSRQPQVVCLGVELPVPPSLLRPPAIGAGMSHGREGCGPRDHVQ